MIEGDIDIINERGMHARAAAKLVELANRFSSKVKITKGTVVVDGKSILGLLLLQAAKGTRIKLSIEGSDEEYAFDRLKEMITDKFGESS